MAFFTNISVPVFHKMALTSLGRWRRRVVSVFIVFKMFIQYINIELLHLFRAHVVVRWFVIGCVVQAKELIFYDIVTTQVHSLMQLRRFHKTSLLFSSV